MQGPSFVDVFVIVFKVALAIALVGAIVAGLVLGYRFATPDRAIGCLVAVTVVMVAWRLVFPRDR